MELNTQEELKAHLMATEPDFRRLVDEHHEHDAKLVELEALHHLTEEQQTEEVRLKKMKLHLKDQMTDFIHHHSLAHSVS